MRKQTLVGGKLVNRMLLGKKREATELYLEEFPLESFF